MTEFGEAVTVGGTAAVLRSTDTFEGVETVDPGIQASTSPELLVDWQEFEPGKRFRALAVVEKDDGGGFLSYSPSLPGAASQGESAEEALENLREALSGCIESYMAAGEKVPWVREPVSVGDALVTRWIDVDV